jgi:hypothetical protein
MSDHVAVRFLRGVDSSLGTLNGQSEGVHDDEGSIDDLALKQAHDLVDAAGSSMDDLWRAQGESAG